MTQLFQILGIKRIIILAALVAINGLLAAVTYMYLEQHNQELSNQLQTLTAQVSGKRNDAARLQSEFRTIQDQKVYFGSLQSGGFFSNQNRSVARQRIDDIQKFTNVLSAKYDITGAQVEKSAGADDAGYVVLNSPVKIEVEALDDVDLYNFIFWVENAFPGQVSTTKVDVTRTMDVNEATLRQLGSGVPVTLIKGTLGFEWRTMVPASQVAPAPPPKG